MTLSETPGAAVKAAGLQGMTLSDIVARHAHSQPLHTFLVDGAARYTYGDVDRQVSVIASALADHGVGAGDRVALMSLNSAAMLEVIIAAIRLGAVCVPINVRLTAAEVGYVLADCGATAIIVDAACASVMSAARDDAASAATLLTIDDLGELAERGASPRSVREIDDTAPAFIVYTSGTTGTPKGAVLSHRNMYLHGYMQIADLGIGRSDNVTLMALPLFHIGGIAAVFPTIITGGTVVFTPAGSFDPVGIVTLLEQEKVSNCSLVPTQWEGICAVPDLDKRDLGALRRIAWGAAPATTTLLRTIMDTFPQASLVSAFGQTETGPITCHLHGSDALRKLGSVGKPVLGMEIRIVDDGMDDVGPGEVGEIVYRGPTVMSGYWNKPTETAAAFRDGWFLSGDLVREDDEGFIYVVDRKKDMIISGGENIYTAEVEECLSAHPAVAEVAVIGAPHSKWGEVPVAIIRPVDPSCPPTVDELAAYARQRLAAYKCPRAVRLVESLPRNATGKVLKRQLRDEMARNPDLANQHVGR